MRPDVAATVGVVAATVLLVELLWRRRGRRPLIPGPVALGTDVDRLAVLMGWVPLMLALHTAVPLFVSGVRGELFVPSLVMERPLSLVAGLAEVGVGLLLFYGFFTRPAALGLAVLWLTGGVVFGPVLMLEQVVFLGIAGFFWIAGRGPVAVDAHFGPRTKVKRRWLGSAAPLLRIAAGASIAWLAFSEKLLNLPLGLRFLERYPWANFFPAVGLPLSDEGFLLLAGGVELTMGLLLIAGAFPRLVILAVWLPFNVTLTAFGWQELVGHLPIYAVMAIVLLWGVGGPEDRAALRRGLVSRSGRDTSAGTPASGREPG